MLGSEGKEQRENRRQKSMLKMDRREQEGTGEKENAQIQAADYAFPMKSFRKETSTNSKKSLQLTATNTVPNLAMNWLKSCYINSSPLLI